MHNVTKIAARSMIVHLFILTGFAMAQEPDTPVDLVNPNIGAISHMLVPTYQTVHWPNSMLRFIPVKSPGISDHYVAPKIHAFPLNVPGHRYRPVTTVMPLAGDEFQDLFTGGEAERESEALAREYDHDFEIVTPYYYAVRLEEPETGIEFSPSPRAGFFRFDFQPQNQAHLIFRAEQEAELHFEPPNAISGHEIFDGVRQYFYAEFRHAPDSCAAFSGRDFKSGERDIGGPKIGMAVTCRVEPGRAVEMKYGISYISGGQARINLQREIPDWDFAGLKNRGREVWNRELGEIELRGGSRDDRIVFYTALYRTLERMVEISEDGSHYSYGAGTVREDPDPFYTDDWSWDTFRAHHPLRILLDPDAENAMIRSYIRLYKESGWMPAFPQVYGDRKCMIGHHQAAIIADAYFKGLRDYDVEAAYQGLRKNAMEGTVIPWQEGEATDLDRFYREAGYFPALAPGEKETEPSVIEWERRQAVSVTLEHAYDDWCLARLARALDKADDCQALMKRAQYYANLYNPASGFFQPKTADGRWIEPFDPRTAGGKGCRDYYAENNAYTYAFSVQHDVAGLIRLMGGADAFVQRLDQLFEESWFGYCKWGQFSEIPDGTGLMGQFVMGNEPSFHTPYLYVYAGAPWKTQKRVRQLVSAFFRNDVMGICGDEDGGAMSAWLVFTALGFYPVCPGMPLYVIGSPLFEEAVLHLGSGGTLTVRALDNSARNKYIQSASLNGAGLDRAWFWHEEIDGGGELVFSMGPSPNKSWGRGELPPPYGE